MLDGKFCLFHGFRIRRLCHGLIARRGRRTHRRRWRCCRLSGSEIRRCLIAFHRADGAHLVELIHAVEACTRIRHCLRIAGGLRHRHRRRCRRLRHGHGLPTLDLREILLREFRVLRELRNLLIRNLHLHACDDIASLDMISILHDKFRDGAIGLCLDAHHRALHLRIVDREPLLAVLVRPDAERAKNRKCHKCQRSEFEDSLDFFCNIDFQNGNLLFSARTLCM